MNRQTKNPEQRGNAATGRGLRTDKGRTPQTPHRHAVRKTLMVQNAKGETIHITAKTRLADVLVKLAAAGPNGISAFDFPAGVRLGALVFKLKGLGIGIETRRQKVAADPFGQHLAVYWLTTSRNAPSI